MNFPQIIHYKDVTSTNDLLYDRIKSGMALPYTAILADFQHQGRGRRGRIWHSPLSGQGGTDGANASQSALGNFHLSIAIPFSSYENIGVMSLVAGIALVETLAQYTDIQKKLWRLKWPNDVMLDGKKTAGILCESYHLNDLFHVIIGTGLNLYWSPDDVLAQDGFPIKGASLRQYSDDLPDKMMLANAYRLNLYKRIEILKDNGFTVLKDEWLSWGPDIGQALKLKAEHSYIKGCFHGLACDGALILVDEQGEISHHYTGDLSGG